MKKIILINSDAAKPNCSMYEFGLAMREALSPSTLFNLEYREVFQGNNLDTILNCDGSDLVIVNYHPATMSWFREYADKIHEPKMLLTAERNHMWNAWDMPEANFNVRRVFQYNGVPIPDMHNEDPDVVILPRIALEVDLPERSVNLENPVISTFGFANPWKRQDVLAQAVKSKFKSATVRIHMPPASYHPIEWNNRAVLDRQTCQYILGDNYQVELHQEHLPVRDLIRWLNESDVNCFFYDWRRDIQSGNGNIPSATDQAVAAGRPMAISDSACMGFLKKYIAPTSNLLEAMSEENHQGVLAAKRDWTPSRFRETLEIFLKERVWS